MYFIFVTVWVIVWLSVPVQLIAWKETRLRNDHVEWNVKPYTLTHSLSREKLTAYSQTDTQNITPLNRVITHSELTAGIIGDFDTLFEHGLSTTVQHRYQLTKSLLHAVTLSRHVSRT